MNITQQCYNCDENAEPFSCYCRQCEANITAEEVAYYEAENEKPEWEYRAGM